MVGVNHSWVKLLVGEKYWSPLKNWSLFTIFSPIWYLELEAYSKPYESLTRYIHTAIVRTVYSGIFQRYSGIFRTLCNACICRNLSYLESGNIHNPFLITYQRYSEPCHIYENWQTCVTLEIQKPGLNDNPGIFRTLKYLQK